MTFKPLRPKKPVNQVGTSHHATSFNRPNYATSSGAPMTSSSISFDRPVYATADSRRINSKVLN